MFKKTRGGYSESSTSLSHSCSGISGTPKAYPTPSLKYSLGSATFAGAPCIINSRSAKRLHRRRYQKLDPPSALSLRVGFVPSTCNTLGEECPAASGLQPAHITISNGTYLKRWVSPREIEAANECLLVTMTSSAPSERTNTCWSLTAPQMRKERTALVHAHGHIRMNGRGPALYQRRQFKTITLPTKLRFEEIRCLYA